MFATMSRIPGKARQIAAITLLVAQAAGLSIALAQIGAVAGDKTPVEAKTIASGFVNSVSGKVFIRRGKGPEETAKAGDMFGAGTTFRTDGESAAVLLFADGQNVALSAASVLTIEDYHFDLRDAKSGRATFGLERGMMRVVTGAIHSGNPDALQISAGKAFVDILSADVTAFVVEVDPVSLSVGSAAVALGEISILTPQGWVVRVASDQFTRWSPGARGASLLPLAAAPAAIQSAASDASLKTIASSSPLDAQSNELGAALAALPATGAGTPEPARPAQAAQSGAPIVVAVGTPGGGGGRGCVGSPC